MAKRFFSAFIAFAIFFNSLAIYADSKLPNLTDFLNSQELSDPKYARFMMEFEHLAASLDRNQISSVPQSIIDPTHLANQRVQLFNSGKMIQEINLSDSIKNIPISGMDEIKFRGEGNNLVIEALLRGEPVRRHIIPDINFAAVARDEEIISILTKDGSIYVIDTPTLILQGFKGILPTFKIYDQNANTKVSLINEGQFSLSYLTRGHMPLFKDQFKEQNNDAIISRDVNKNPIITMGDLIIKDGNKNVKGILNREAIRDIIKRETTRLALTISLSTNEGFGRNIKERLEYLYGNDSRKLSPFENLINIVDEMSKESPVTSLEENTDEELRHFIEKAMHGFNREELKHLIDRVKAYSQKSPKDKLTASEWVASFEMIRNQSPKTLLTLEEELKKRKGLASVEIESAIDVLKDNQLNNDYRQTYRALMKDALYEGKDSPKYSFLLEENISTPFSAIISRTLNKQIDPKELAKFSWRLTKPALIALGALKGMDYLLDNSLSVKFHIMTNWLWNKSIYSHFNAYPEFIAPYFLGMSSMLLLIPTLYLFGNYSMAMLYSAVNFAEKHPKFGKLKNPIKPSVLNALRIFSIANKNNNAQQNIIAMTSRVYAALMFPIYNRIATLTNQPTMIALAAGISPFMKIVADSPIGKELGLKEGEKFRVGFNGSMKENDELLRKQIRALSLAAKEKRTAKDLAHRLAYLVLSYEKDIDPATLSLLVDQDLSIDEMKIIFSDAEIKKKWEFAARSSYADLLNLINQNKIDLREVNPSDLIQFYHNAKQSLSLLENGKSIKLILRNLKNIYLINVTGFAQAIAGFAKDDYYKLTTLLPNRLVAKQNGTEFVSDQAIVASLTPSFGERTNINHPLFPNNFGHLNDHFLWTTPSHGMDVAQNFYAHQFASGPLTMLELQTPKPKPELNYSPVSPHLLDSTPNHEKISLSAIRWVKGILNVPKSNIGKLFLMQDVRRFTMIQMAFITVMIFRIGVGHQDLNIALKGWFYAWNLSTLCYAWPWRFLRTGNQMEEGRITQRHQVNLGIQENITEAILRNDESALLENYKKLLNVWQETDGELESNAKKIMSSTKVAWNIDPKDLAKRIENDKEGPVLIGLLVDINDALLSENVGLAQSRIRLMKSILQDGMSVDQIDQALSYQLKDKAIKMVNFSIKHSPTPNIANKYFSSIATFMFGAVLTTLLMANLILDSQNPDKLKPTDLALSLIEGMGFTAAMYAVFSKRSFEQYSKTWIYKNTIQKIVDYNRYLGTCPGLLRKFFR